MQTEAVCKVGVY